MNAIKKYFKGVKKDIEHDQTHTVPTNRADRPITIDEIDDSDDLAIDTYKVVTIATDQARPFLIYGDEGSAETPLSSGALMRLLDYRHADSSFLEKLFDLKGAEVGIEDPSFTLADNRRFSSMCRWFGELNECATVLKEGQIFYNFDPYCNFLLGEKSTLKDVKHIVKSTTSSDASDPNACLRFDFTNMVNPYGLERVVFTGGGTKGNIYIGTTMGLLASGQIFYLNHFRGSSIGGLSAMVTACTTPPEAEYVILSRMTLREIMTRGCWIVRRYQRAIEFATARFCERDMDTFYEKPSYSFYGIWTMASKIMRNNGLYDPEKSGFQVWYALICLRICQIMTNGLADKIVVRDENNKLVRFIEEYSSKDHRYTDTFRKNRKKSSKTPNREDTDVTALDSGSDDAVVEIVEIGNADNADNAETAETAEPAETDNEKENTSYFGSGIFSSSSDDTNYRDIRESDLDSIEFIGWTVETFFTFQEYYDLTGKTIMFTGTKTDPVETVYYCLEDPKYQHMTVLRGARATMSIPWVFEAPIIDGSYHLDGGIYDNFPLTTDDIKVKGRIKHYNNKVFGYLIDDQNSIIDAYEVMRELWLVYTGFLQIMNVGYLSEAPNFDEISRLFFEIRSEVYKMIYFADTEIVTFLSDTEVDRSTESYNISGLRDVMSVLSEHMGQSNYLNFKLAKRGAAYIEDCLLELRGSDHRIRRRNSGNSGASNDSDFERKFKIGRTTDLSDIMHLTVDHGTIYNELTHLIKSDLREIERLDLDGTKMKIVKRYEKILNHLMRDILAYYEVKGTFIRTNDLDQPCRYFVRLLKDLSAKLNRFNELTNAATELLKNVKTSKTAATSDSFKNFIQPSIDIGLTMISKIVTRGTGNDYDIKDIQSSQNSASYQKVVDYFFHTDMTGILYKYMCIANDRICNDTFNQMRTIKLNTFETNVLHFDMGRDLKCRLIYEGYSKTIKFFANQLRIMEMTKRRRAMDDLVPSYEVKYKRLYGR
jgi:Patatin-like phospholipase